MAQIQIDCYVEDIEIFQYQIQCAVSVGGVEQMIMFDTISDVN
jgi:hypothetical protein